MNTQISPDFERLSAFVDDQLSPAEKAELESRLAKEPELQASLNDLRQTVRALRSLPTVKPPRSFTLTPAQVGVRARRGPLFPVFRLGAALCALVLTLAVARDFATSGLSASATHDVTTQSGAVTPLSLPQASPLLTPTSEASVESYGASAPAVTSTPSTDIATTPLARLNAVEPSATAAVAPTKGGPPVPATSEATSKNVAPSSTPEDTAVSVAALPPDATVTSAPIVAPQPAEQGPNGLRLVEIALAVLALALAAAAWITRRG